MKNQYHSYSKSKKYHPVRWLACLASIFFLSSCASSRCECESYRQYKPKKARISLIDNQKNTTFALQNSGKKDCELSFNY